MRGFCDADETRSQATELEPSPLTAAGHAWLHDPHSGRRFFLLGPFTMIGRSAPSQLALGADPYLSRRHAVIHMRDEDYWFVDLESANGSFINQRQVSGPQRLSAGDTLQLGMTSLRFERAVGDRMPAEECHA